jgi:hypothetical protein
VFHDTEHNGEFIIYANYNLILTRTLLLLTIPLKRCLCAKYHDNICMPDRRDWSITAKAGRALDRLGTAQSAEVKLNGNKLKPAHWIGSARHGTVRRGKTEWKQMEARALDRLGTAQSAEVKLSGDKWKPAHCIGTARLGTDLPARIGTVPE